MESWENDGSPSSERWRGNLPKLWHTTSSVFLCLLLTGSVARSCPISNPLGRGRERWGSPGWDLRLSSRQYLTPPCQQMQRGGHSPFQISQLLDLSGASLKGGTSTPESLWFAIKIHHSFCKANARIMCRGLDLGNPSRPILSHTQVLLCHSCYEELFKNSALRRSGGQGVSWLLCNWRHGPSPDTAPAFAGKGHFNVRQWEAKFYQCIKGFASLSSKGIKGIERISWRNLMLFRLVQSSEELWSICKNKKEDPRYSPSAFMLSHCRWIHTLGGKDCIKSCDVSCHIPNYLL